MEEQIERWQCHRCLVRYNIAPPQPENDRFSCSTPDCGKLFWTGHRKVGSKNVVTMNMEAIPS